MICINPPALSDEALSLALDGLADAEIQQHLDQCPACAERLAKMKHFERTLQAHLRRFDCPPAQDLADFHAGMLDEEAAAVVSDHLAHCPVCRAELEMLSQFLDLPPENDSVPDNIIPFRIPPAVRRTFRVETSGSLALKGLKGEQDEFHDERSGSARIFLESKAVAGGVVLIGQVIDSQVNWRGAVAEIRQGGITQQVKILDETSEFSFELSSAAPATLSITASSGATLIVENLTFNT